MKCTIYDEKRNSNKDNAKGIHWHYISYFKINCYSDFPGGEDLFPGQNIEQYRENDGVYVSY